MSPAVSPSAALVPARKVRPFLFLPVIIWMDVQPMGLVVLGVSLESLWSLWSPSPKRSGGSRLPGCHGSLPAVLVFLRPFPANFQGTSSQAHLFAMSLNVARL